MAFNATSVCHHSYVIAQQESIRTSPLSILCQTPPLRPKQANPTSSSATDNPSRQEELTPEERAHLEEEVAKQVSGAATQKAATIEAHGLLVYSIGVHTYYVSFAVIRCTVYYEPMGY